MGSCTAQCEMLLFCAKTFVMEFSNQTIDSPSEKMNQFWQFGDFLVWYLQCGAIPDLLCTTNVTNRSDPMQRTQEQGSSTS